MKLLFVSPVVQEFDILQNAVLQDVSLQSTYSISINDIPDDTTHIAFMFHTVDAFPFLPTLDNKDMSMKSKFEFGRMSNFKDKYCNTFFKGFEYIFDLLNNRNVPIIIDLLSCNLPKSIIDMLPEYSNIIFRISLDKTGNDPYGNWIMEYSNNTHIQQNIKSVYFNDYIDNWSILLNEIIYPTFHGVFIDLSNNFTINNKTIKLNDNITITNQNDISNSYIIIPSDWVFDGKNNYIDLSNSTLCKGIILDTNTSSDKHLTIQNLGIKNGNLQPGVFTKIYGKSYFLRYGGNKYVDISNCYSTGPISERGGGFVPEGLNSIHNITITNCYNEGSIGPSAGGLCGSAAGINGYLTINNCINKGIISGYEAGGFCGNQVSHDGGMTTIKNSYNTGDINGNIAGGICGSNSCIWNGSLIILNCYNIGDVNGENSGGITGTNTGISGKSFILKNCYNTGNVNNQNSNSIIGGISSNLKHIEMNYIYTYQDSAQSVIVNDITYNTLDINQIFDSNIDTLFSSDTTFIRDTFGERKEFPLITTFRQTPWDEISYSNYDDIATKKQIDTIIINSDICFPKNTPIETDQGIISIQNLIPGYHTIQQKEIRYVTQTKLKNQKQLMLFKKDCLYKNVPRQNTKITMNHKILYENNLIPSKYFELWNPNVKRVRYNNETLYNIVMENHEIINVNNMEVETLHPDHKIVKIYDKMEKLTNIEKKIFLERINNINQSINKTLNS